MATTTLPAPYMTSDKLSFAFVTVCKRWPVILTSVVNDVHLTVSELILQSSKLPEGEERNEITAKVAELQEIQKALSVFTHEIEHNRPITPVLDDGFEDVAIYNTFLESLKGPANNPDRNPELLPRWHDAPWLWTECYLFRRLNAYFQRTTHWKSYDIFARQKRSAFRSSRPAVVELAARYASLLTQLSTADAKGHSKETDYLLFTEMAEICLWGNATDLSLLTNCSYEDLQKLQGSQARKASESNILANDLPAAFSLLYEARASRPKEPRRVDIVLDNAGFELYVDLVLAGYLLEANLATEVVLHPKSMPWFVSDVLPSDFATLLSAIAAPESFFEAPDERAAEPAPVVPLSAEEKSALSTVFNSWSQMHAEGKLVIRPHRYWTYGAGFSGIKEDAPELHADLATSELVIFKGDLNYRKLTGDLAWEPTTPFTTALGALGPGSGVNVLALRTCKADVVVGLPRVKTRNSVPRRMAAPMGKGENGVGRASMLFASYR